jgi:dTDP-glucose 4,6-dehydratase
MRLLITGAAGFIGANFVRFWVGRHPADHLVALDLLTYAGNEGSLADVADRITFVRGDIGDQPVWTRKAGIRPPEYASPPCRYS